MPLGETSYLRIATMAEADTQKYLLFNTGIQKIEDSLNRILTLDFTAANVTLTEGQFTSYQTFICENAGVARDLEIPATVGSGPAVPSNRFIIVDNRSTSTITVTHNNAGTDFDVLANSVSLLVCDGTDITAASSSGLAGFVIQEDDVETTAAETVLNFEGNVTTLDETTKTTITIGGITGIEIQENDAQTTASETVLNFEGDVATLDEGGKTTITFTSTGIAGVEVQEADVQTTASETVLNFEGNVTTLDETSKTTITIGGINGIAVQEDDAGVSSDETVLNFEGFTSVTDEGSKTTIIAGTDYPELAVDEETATTYTTVLADFAGNVVKKMNNASDITVTVAASISAADAVTFIQEGAGQVIFVEDSGVTIKCKGSGDRTVGQYSAATLIPDLDAGADVYWLIGDTE